MIEAATVVNPHNSQSDAPSSDDLAALSLDERQVTAVNPSHLAMDSTSSDDIEEPETSAGIPITTNSHIASTSFSQAATPMNETFLSTLAPGMSQRFDLADQEGSSQGHGSTAGSGVPETLEEESDDMLDERRSGEGSDDLIFN
jgi:hypothetical protein